MMLYCRQDVGLLLQGAGDTAELRAHQLPGFSSLMVGLRSGYQPGLQPRAKAISASEKTHMLFPLRCSSPSSGISPLPNTRRFLLLPANAAP